jgi:predicted DNA-binding transcriptional regulator YafY
VSEEKPKDWIAHKHGAKQNVFTVDFNKISKKYNTLTFESDNILWLSEIVLGFEFNSQVLAPKEISLEIG